MSQIIPPFQRINHSVQKTVSLTKHQCQQFAQKFFVNIDPKCFDKAIVIFEDALKQLTNVSKESYDSALRRAQQKLRDFRCIDINQRLQMQNSNNKLPNPIYQIRVRKQKDKEYNQGIENHWREARSNFFTHRIRQKLNEAQIQKLQAEIVSIFMQARQQPNYELDLGQLGILSDYGELIQQLHQQFQEINRKFSQKRKECPAIADMIQLKLTSLRIIRIQYKIDGFQQCPYQISAFELFRFIHRNRDLSFAQFKRVSVTSFSQFIEAMISAKSQEMGEDLNQQQSWMKEFKPRSLKLAINVFLQFQFKNLENTLQQLRNFVEFTKLFDQLSDLCVEMRLIKEEAQNFKKALGPLTKWLAMIKKVKLKVIGDHCNNNAYQQFVLVLQELACLTEITSLAFENIWFPAVEINRFSAIEQTLRTIFENNVVSHLKLKYCINFPILPRLATLQKINLRSVYFRKQFDFLSELNKSNQRLKWLRYKSIQEQRIISEQQIDQLETLQIESCNSITFDILTQSTSNIQHLKIYGSIFRNADFILLFHKLANLQSLYLSHTSNFGHQILCTIPSPSLECLHIHNNHEIEEKALEAIDKKWPRLRKIGLYNCPRLNERGWNACEFRGLMELQIDALILQHGHPIRQQLRRRGIKVY